MEIFYHRRLLLPPGRTIEDLTIPDNLSIATQEKAWLNEHYISHGMKKYG